MLLSVAGAMDHSITCIYAYFMYTETSGTKLLYCIVLYCVVLHCIVLYSFYAKHLTLCFRQMPTTTDLERAAACVCVLPAELLWRRVNGGDVVGSSETLIVILYHNHDYLDDG